MHLKCGIYSVSQCLFFSSLCQDCKVFLLCRNLIKPAGPLGLPAHRTWQNPRRLHDALVRAQSTPSVLPAAYGGTLWLFMTPAARTVQTALRKSQNVSGLGRISNLGPSQSRIARISTSDEWLFIWIRVWLRLIRQNKCVPLCDCMLKQRKGQLARLHADLPTPEGSPLNPCLECRYGSQLRRKVACAIFEKGEVRMLMHVHS